ncbi:hypothetical protein NM688_g1884 [Phlebia brevispora]|uniref:Uncharacterized protein n=1 Tax=Phlebia brevispora TaxID=194682 RepID=A0ACC1TA96_9APHY|nr:hypothetical protein NM688_g1884 [Phlebia brevispora]
MERLPHSRDSDNQHRTAQWVIAQAGQTYESLPPSPTFAAATMRIAPSSNRTTASSEQSLATSSTMPTRRYGSERHLSSSHTNPIPNYSVAVPPANLSAREQMKLPFPQSPPGSGYPLMLEVASPRAEPDRTQSKVGRHRIAQFSLLNRVGSFLPANEVVPSEET